MIRMGILGAVLALCLLPGSAPPPKVVETITISHRFNDVVCTGYCTDSDLVVRSDGVVEHRIRMIHHRWKHFRYTVTPQQFEAFRAALAPIRPVGTRGPTGDCDNPEYVHGLNATEIRWRGGGPDGTLLSCLGDDVHPAANPYRALGIRSTGGRLDASTDEDSAK